MKKRKIKSIVGVLPTGERIKFSINNVDQMIVQEFSSVEIVEEMTQEEVQKYYPHLLAWGYLIPLNNK